MMADGNHRIIISGHCNRLHSDHHTLAIMKMYFKLICVALTAIAVVEAPGTSRSQQFGKTAKKQSSHVKHSEIPQWTLVYGKGVSQSRIDFISDIEKYVPFYLLEKNLIAADFIHNMYARLTVHPTPMMRKSIVEFLNKAYVPDNTIHAAISRSSKRSGIDLRIKILWDVSLTFPKSNISNPCLAVDDSKHWWRVPSVTQMPTFDVISYEPQGKNVRKPLPQQPFNGGFHLQIVSTDESSDGTTAGSRSAGV
eukprot:Lankesteria_metandrocarpae@DN1719_c0_g1_i1.p1